MFVYQRNYRNSTGSLFTVSYVMDGYLTPNKAYKMAKSVFKDILKYGIPDFYFSDYKEAQDVLKKFSLNYIWNDIAKTIKARSIRNVQFKNDGSLMEKHGLIGYEQMVIVK